MFDYIQFPKNNDTASRTATGRQYVSENTDDKKKLQSL